MSVPNSFISEVFCDWGHPRGTIRSISTRFGPTQSWVEKAEHQAFNCGADLPRKMNCRSVMFAFVAIVFVLFVPSFGTAETERIHKFVVTSTQGTSLITIS